MCEEERLEDNTKLQKQDGGAWTRLSGTGTGVGAVVNMTVVPIKCGSFFLTSQGIPPVTTTIKASWDCVFLSFLHLVAGYGIFGHSNVDYMLPGKDKNIFVLAFTRRNCVHIFLFLMEIRWVYPGYYFLRLDKS
jgi:hypothetical protein